MKNISMYLFCGSQGTEDIRLGVYPVYPVDPASVHCNSVQSVQHIYNFQGVRIHLNQNQRTKPLQT